MSYSVFFICTDSNLCLRVVMFVLTLLLILIYLTVIFLVFLNVICY